jgi:hypothetical protein
VDTNVASEIAFLDESVLDSDKIIFQNRIIQVQEEEEADMGMGLFDGCNFEEDVRDKNVKSVSCICIRK